MKKHPFIPLMVIAMLIALLGVPASASTGAKAQPTTHTALAYPKWVVDSGPHWVVSVKWDDINGKVVFDKQSSRALLWVLAARSISGVRQYLNSIAWQFPIESTYCVDLWFFTACHTFKHIRDHWQWDVVTRNDLYRAVVRASYIYGTCFDWQFTGHRNFNHTGTDCKEVRR